MPTPLCLLRVAKYLDDTEKQHLDPMEFPRSNASGGWKLYVFTPQKSNVDNRRYLIIAMFFRGVTFAFRPIILGALQPLVNSGVQKSLQTTFFWASTILKLPPKKN